LSVSETGSGTTSSPYSTTPALSLVSAAWPGPWFGSRAAPYHGQEPGACARVSGQVFYRRAGPFAASQWCQSAL